MNTYRAGFVGRGKVIHISNDRIALCFDSFAGNSRKIEFASAVADSAQEALNKAVEATGAKVCEVCAKVGA